MGECEKWAGKQTELFHGICRQRIPHSIWSPEPYSVGLLAGNIFGPTSNFGNPALRLFGFGPIAADDLGLGIVYRCVSTLFPFYTNHFMFNSLRCASPKHLQT